MLYVDSVLVNPQNKVNYSGVVLFYWCYFNSEHDVHNLRSALVFYFFGHCSFQQREEALEIRKKFLSHEGDHVTLLNIYRAYKAAKGNKVCVPVLLCTALWPWSLKNQTSHIKHFIDISRNGALRTLSISVI